MKTIYKTQTEESGHIEVIDQDGELLLLVEGACQSIYSPSGVDKGYWPHLVPDRPVSNVLIMGLGGGTVAGIIRNKHPQAKIVAYEIDPRIVEITREYFNLDERTEVRIESAEEAFKTGEKWDLVIVDLYHGLTFYPEADTSLFLDNVRGILDIGGQAVFNRADTLISTFADAFPYKLKDVFGSYREVNADLNTIYWVEKAGKSLEAS